MQTPPSPPLIPVQACSSGRKWLMKPAAGTARNKTELNICQVCDWECNRAILCVASSHQLLKGKTGHSFDHATCLYSCLLFLRGSSNKARDNLCWCLKASRFAFETQQVLQASHLLVEIPPCLVSDRSSSSSEDTPSPSRGIQRLTWLEEWGETT